MVRGTLFKTLILIALSSTLLACQQDSGALALEPNDINKIPVEMDIPEGLDEPEYSNPPITTGPVEKPAVKPTETPKVVPQPDLPPPSTATSSDQKPQDDENDIQASELIEKAHWTMIHEGKKIGTPCNFYLIRVLQLAGFPKGAFLANDFDVYAKKNFASYKAVDFTLDARLSEEGRLKKYLWSYPQRKPFIMQWTRRRGPGHVAIVERIGDSLIIYQASLNRHTANRTQTKPSLLLKMGVGAVLTVYTDFVSR